MQRGGWVYYREDIYNVVDTKIIIFPRENPVHVLLLCLMKSLILENSVALWYKLSRMMRKVLGSIPLCGYLSRI